MKLFKQCKQSAVLIVSFIVCLDSLSGIGAIDFKNLAHHEDGAYQATEVIGKNPIDLIRMRGFKAELHYARTSDGYYIHLARIVNPLIGPNVPLKRPVIFNHGLLESSTIWLIHSNEVKPLPYTGQCNSTADEFGVTNETLYQNGPMMLANHGYDVWLMSMRGTEWSLHHDFLTPLDDEFWDYSLDNFGLKDVPSVVDYVRLHTGAPKVGYIGHSQATFSVFALLSTYPNYGDFIKPIIAVAPVSYFHHTTSLGRPLFLGTLKATDSHLNGPFPPNARLLRTAITAVCSSDLHSKPPLICSFIEMLVAGKGEQWLKGYYSHLPFMTSLKVLRHFGALIKNKQFQRYDYGEKRNMKIYGSRKAPAYMIEMINSKYICLISTKSDALSHKHDVELFRQRLKVPLYRDIYIDGNFDHFDLVLDKAAGKLVYKPILEILESLEVESGACDVFQDKYNSINEASGY